MRFLDTIDGIILNGRYQPPNAPTPYTFHRGAQQTIVDYSIILGRQFHRVEKCEILGRAPTRQSDCIPTDHNPILTTLSLPTTGASPTKDSEFINKRPPRTQYHSSRLKDPETLKCFKTRVEARSEELLPKLRTLRQASESGAISNQEYADAGQAAITQALQEEAEAILQPVSLGEHDRPPVVQAHSGDRNTTHHSSPNAAVRALQTQSQRALNTLRQAKRAGAPPTTIAQPPTRSSKIKL